MQRFPRTLRLVDERTRQSEICRSHNRCKLHLRRCCTPFEIRPGD
jgi:hypothetical protein